MQSYCSHHGVSLISKEIKILNFQNMFCCFGFAVHFFGFFFVVCGGFLFLFCFLEIPSLQICGVEGEILNEN